MEERTTVEKRTTVTRDTTPLDTDATTGAATGGSTNINVNTDDANAGAAVNVNEPGVTVDQGGTVTERTTERTTRT